ncbi:MerR family transcriptional regulator [Luteimonas lutimaris]|uniref:Mercuric resistance operon regulatory protein n=1 Tax=Luteimonas lutimaris TaxID=698645 RepID=A0ABP7M9Y5_9GAMM
MNIGQLARQAGVPIDTVRYYERQGLIPEPPRSTSGYRQYGPGDVTRLEFIRRAKTLGFTLEEIGELMAISGNYSNDMKEMKQKASTKLQVVEARLEELVRMRDALRGLVDACPGHGPLAACPIMAALTTDPATDSSRAA